MGCSNPLTHFGSVLLAAANSTGRYFVCFVIVGEDGQVIQTAPHSVLAWHPWDSSLQILSKAYLLAAATSIARARSGWEMKVIEACSKAL